MRIGFNPNKDQQNDNLVYFHQIIIPVYIPNQESYFKNSLAILKLCLESLFLTVHKKTFITIVNNGSCAEVKNYLQELYLNEKIHELLDTTNIGKLNAILKGVVGHNFPLITITDSDVLFLNGWQDATYSVFNNFQKAGIVCPTPSSRSLRTFTSNIYWDKILSKDLSFSKVKNPLALKNFANSIGSPDFYNKAHLEKYFTISNKNEKAVVGAGHFAGTYRGIIFNDLKIKYSNYKLGGDSESKILDIPVVQNDLWRLSTSDNYAYHMGNVMEDWMKEEVSKLELNQIESDFVLKPIKLGSKWTYFVKSKFFGKIILNKKVMKYFIRYKGLSKDEAENYLK
ncbi:glycosyltransferase family 2 protein [Flavobacterium johnsoniae]|uniref:glycosyltransferase family 2 protein n=1 Tax=Flavobacterium johnsoniae TaxID=986 RepID=UPI0025AF12DD|nr:glycosyltransferase family 2 protein [Flavobacterium johnsoniae]WJS95131.1 glycosyltransferase family 2 protein [Flavobacterium johnsoniae]